MYTAGLNRWAVAACAVLSMPPLLQAQGVRALQDALGEFAARNNMKALRTPVRGLNLGWILDDKDAVIRTNCWDVRTVDLSGMDTTHIEGVVNKSSGLNLGVGFLNLFGFNISAGKERLDSIFLDFGQLKAADGADASFNWEQKDCLSLVRRGPIRVLDRLLATSTLAARVSTNSSQRFALDSAKIDKGGVKISLDIKLGKPENKGITLVNSDSGVAIARAVHQWELNKITCSGDHLVLTPGRAMTPPTSQCPGTAADDGWYSARIVSVDASGITISVQALNTGAAPTRRIVEPGVEFVLDTLAQRLDLGRLDPRGRNYSLTVTRLEVRRKPKVLGVRVPLSRAEASRGARLSEPAAPSE